MASRGKRVTSPTKSQNQKFGTNNPNQSELNASNNGNTEYIVLDKDLVRGLSEKDVEIDHLKTTVVALQEKVEVRNSHLSYKNLLSSQASILLLNR